MQFIRFFTSFKGRIGRAKWWLGLVTVLAVSICGEMILNPALFNTPYDQPLPPPGLASVLFGLLMAVPTTAITVKRFNDNGRPYWCGYLVGAFYVVFTAAPAFGYLVDPPSYSTPENFVNGIFLLVGLISLIDNGFIGGTRGPNRYGLDPLQP